MTDKKKKFDFFFEKNISISKDKSILFRIEVTFEDNEENINQS